MPRPRKTLVNTNDTPYYHCISRCVRRAFLCGEDQVTGKNFDHRKQWLVDRIKHLSHIFSIDICAYAVMSNHYHIVVHIDSSRPKKWSDREILIRWTKLFKGPSIVQRYLRGQSLVQAEMTLLDRLIKEYRQRLTDLSWFMRCLNEPIARDANFEDRCTGRFWEGRFKSKPLLSTAALLSCMAYVDLNPVRAGIADSTVDSDFTSIQERLFQYAERNIQKQNSPKNRQPSTHSNKATSLFPFLGNEHLDKAQPGIFYHEIDYFELVDWTGRIVRADKRGYISADTPRILELLNFDSDFWVELVQSNSSKGNYRLQLRLAA